MDMINIIDFGVRENVVQTKAIQNALDFATEHGGLTVKIPRGTFITGTLNLGSASLHLEKGAVLLASGNPKDYYDNGFAHNELQNCISLIFSLGENNISIFGEGTIDMNAGAFYNQEEREIPDYDVEFKYEQIEECMQTYTFRPTQPIFFYECNHLQIKDITIKNAPCQTISFHDSEDIHVTDVTIENDPTIPDNDGLHFCGCRKVFIRGCHIVCGDDCIALSGITDWDKACENFVISDCILQSCSKAIALGYVHSIIRNVTISNCVVMDSHRGLCIMSNAGTGLVEHILVENLRVDTRIRAGNWWGNGEPISIIGLSHDYEGYLKPTPQRSWPINISDVHFKNISCSGENVIAILGENQNIANISFHGVSYEKKDSKNRYLKGDRVIDVGPSRKIAVLPADNKEFWLIADHCKKLKVSNASVAEYHGDILGASVTNCPEADCRGILVTNTDKNQN